MLRISIRNRGVLVFSFKKHKTGSNGNKGVKIFIFLKNRKQSARFILMASPQEINVCSTPLYPTVKTQNNVLVDKHPFIVYKL